MSMKTINSRCPLQEECGRKKCEFQYNELKCDYYKNNGIGDNTIPDQEEIRRHEEISFEENLFYDDYTESNIVSIPIEQLYPHPDNPRKAVGDVSELAESIKVNGILQNLTVVEGHYRTEEEYKALCEQYRNNPTEDLRHKLNSKKSADGFTVIIGHRRLEAAKLAGISELPCVIVEMTDKQQISTMLTENMQRVELTVYEQAQGFQMMFDMGDSVEAIAEKSGFSRSTVKKRLEIAKLDQKTLQKVSSRQLVLEDFDELAKIEDIDIRNKILNEIGTPNFRNSVARVIQDQKAKRYYRKILKSSKHLPQRIMT